MARSNEAKALGVKMGAPWFTIRHLEDEYGLNVASIGSPIGKVKLLDTDDGTKTVAQMKKLPTDDPLEGMRQWYVCYSVSTDGGRTWPVTGRVIQDGPEFSPEHPLPGVWIGKNCVMVGDVASVPVFLRDGTLLVPVIITPLAISGADTPL